MFIVALSLLSYLHHGKIKGIYLTLMFLCIVLQANLTLQDGSEGKVCLHWAAESAHPAAPNIVQLLCKKQNNLIEAKVSLHSYTYVSS